MDIDFDSAFVTGSRAYGTPRDDSDLDLVILVTQEVSDELFKHGKTETGTCRFGMLNLICFTSEEDYFGWKDVTNKLIKQKPVSREFAIEQFAKAGFSGVYQK